MKPNKGKMLAPKKFAMAWPREGKEVTTAPRTSTKTYAIQGPFFWVCD